MSILGEGKGEIVVRAGMGQEIRCRFLVQGWYGSGNALVGELVEGGDAFMLGRDVTSHVWQEGQQPISRNLDIGATLTEALHIEGWAR